MVRPGSEKKPNKKSTVTPIFGGKIDRMATFNDVT